MKIKNIIVYLVLFVIIFFGIINFLAKNWYTSLNYKDDFNLNMNVELHALQRQEDTSKIYDWVYVLGSSSYNDYAHVIIENYMDTFKWVRNKTHSITFLYYTSGMPLSESNNDQRWLGHDDFWDKYLLKINYIPSPTESFIIRKYKKGEVSEEIQVLYNEIIKIGLGEYLRGVHSRKSSAVDL